MTIEMKKMIGPGAGETPRQPGRRRLALLMIAGLGVLIAGATFAAPRIPADDSAVLEILPDAKSLQTRALRAAEQALAAKPGDLPAALAVARAAIHQARREGDPRWLGHASAALAPFLTARPGAQISPDVRLLHAIILQSTHDFPASLDELAIVLRADPNNGQALLTRAAIRLVRADLAGASADCAAFAQTRAGLLADSCTASVMAQKGAAPRALRALTLSLASHALEAAQNPETAAWAATIAAETAAHLGDTSADARFHAALAIDATDPYVLAAYSDFLLAHDRAAEVVTLLASHTKNDPLLLRLTLAEIAVRAPLAANHIADLGARFEASRLRGESVHRREEARYRLDITHEPARALALARANWQVQREPADAAILLAAGRANQDEAAIATAHAAIALAGWNETAMLAGLMPVSQGS